MPENRTHQCAALSTQLALYLPRDHAVALAQVLADVRAGRVDALMAEKQLTSDKGLSAAVHGLAAHAVALDVPGSTSGILFAKDADLRVASITIGDVVRHTSTPSGGSGAREVDSGTVIYQAVLRIPPRDQRPLPWQLPYEIVAPLVGREHELAALVDLFHGADATAPVVLAGLAGSGKRRLAATFATHQRVAFPGGIFWIRLGQPDEVAAQVASCAGPDGLALPGGQSLSLAARVDAVYAAWNEPTPRLLVLDDVRDAAQLARWCPVGGGCRVLALASAWPVGERVIPIGPLARAASRHVLLEERARASATAADALVTDPTQAQLADAICADMGDMPLPLTLAGAVLATMQQMTLSAYLSRVAQVFRAHESVSPTTRADEDHGVRAAVFISIDLLRSYGTVGIGAQRLLRRLALCATACLPGDVLPRLVGVTPEVGAVWDQTAAALRLLQRLRLVIVADQYAWVHPVVAQLARIALPVEADDAPCIERGLIGSALAFRDERYRAPAIALLPHLLQAIRIMGPRANDQAATLLLNGAAILQRTGDLEHARPFYERALAISTTLLGHDHSATVRIVTTLGRLLEAQGDILEAQSYFERALASTEHIYGPDAPPTAAILEQLGALLERQGFLGRARRYYERALAIYEHLFGSEHPDTASSMITLGHVLQAQGEYSQARNLYERALEVCEQLLGPHHQATARTLHGLGLVCEQQGDLWSAQRCYERALAIREQALGPQHADTARSLHMLAYVLHLGDSFDQARAYYARALAIREAILGPQHADTASTLNNLGHLCELEGDVAAAQKLYERALHACVQSLGVDHAHTEVVRTNLAVLADRLRKG